MIDLKIRHRQCLEVVDPQVKPAVTTDINKCKGVSLNEHSLNIV